MLRRVHITRPLAPSFDYISLPTSSFRHPSAHFSSSNHSAGKHSPHHAKRHPKEIVSSSSPLAPSPSSDEAHSSSLKEKGPTQPISREELVRQAALRLEGTLSELSAQSDANGDLPDISIFNACYRDVISAIVFHPSLLVCASGDHLRSLPCNITGNLFALAFSSAERYQEILTHLQKLLAGEVAEPFDPDQAQECLRTMQEVRAMSGARLIAQLTSMLHLQPPPSGLSLNFTSAIPFPDETINMVMQNHYFQTLLHTLVSSQSLPRPLPHEIFNFNSTLDLTHDVQNFPVWFIDDAVASSLILDRHETVLPVFSDFILFKQFYGGTTPLPKTKPFSHAIEIALKNSSIQGILLNSQPSNINLYSYLLPKNSIWWHR